MQVRLVAVEIHDQKLYAPTGLVGRWASSVRRQLKSHAIAQAPHGAAKGRDRKTRTNAGEPPGSLKKGIRASTARTGPRSLDIILTSTASYSVYVLKGTGPIFSRSARIPKGSPGAGQFSSLSEGGGMYLPYNRRGKARVRQHVRGQTANPFFDRAVAATALKHSSLRGFNMR
jgi:hypothetical protein